MKISIIVLVACYFAFVAAITPVQKCPQGKDPEEYKQIVTVGHCKKPPCKLRKARSVPAEFKFTPDHDVKKLTNTVNALIAGLPVPFIGVDNTDACGKIYESDGTKLAGCPLTAGKEYVYKENIQVLEVYPKVNTVVHWGLTGDDGVDVMCFQVATSIIDP